MSADTETLCRACGHHYGLRDGGEDTGYCDPCAQDMVADAARWRAFVGRVSAHEVGKSGMVFFHFPTLGGGRELLQGSVAQHFAETVDRKFLGVGKNKEEANGN